MPACELCGANVARVRPVYVEGTVLRVCDACARFGKEVPESVVRVERTTRTPVVAVRRPRPRDVFAEMPEDELAPDFHERIRKAREGRGWKQRELAAKIAERESVIAKLEAGSMRPDDALRAKLERALGVSLQEKPPKVAAPKGKGKPTMTLGDLLDG